MSDPVRLRKAGSSFEANLLDAARDDVMGRHVGKNVRKALGLGAAMAVAATTSTAAAGATGGASAVGAAGATKGAGTVAALAAAKWLGVVAVGALALGGASALISQPHSSTPVTSSMPTEAHPAAPTSKATPKSMPPSTPASIPLSAPIPDTTSETVAPIARPSSTAPSPMPSTPSASVAPASSSLRAELSPIDAARAAFDSGNTELALGDLNRHDLQFPHGQLAPEALALRIEIYASRRDDSMVTELANRFLSRYADHPQAARVRAISDAAVRGARGAYDKDEAHGQ